MAYLCVEIEQIVKVGLSRAKDFRKQAVGSFVLHHGVDNVAHIEKLPHRITLAQQPERKRMGEWRMCTHRDTHTAPRTMEEKVRLIKNKRKRTWLGN